MEAGRSSRTAERVASRRAAHQLLDVPLVFEDPIAIHMLPPDVAAHVRERPRDFDRSPLARYLRALLAVRSRFAEDRLAEAVARGVTQYVIVGAGFDTFAYRNPYPALRVFELDHPATQAVKRRRVAEAKLEVGENVTYVAADLAEVPLRDALVRGGFDESQPAVFAWLGVVPYLERPAIEAVLRYVASLPRRTEIVFDYGVPPKSLPLIVRIFYWRVARRVAAAGEPWKSYFTGDEMQTLLRTAGFDTIEDLGADEINARYFAGRRDGLKVGNAGRTARAGRGAR
jgi:methyltransferase (TIGR00027 family)